MNTAQAPLLRVQNLVKSYSLRTVTGATRKITAVDNVSLDVNAGETIAIVGESGCGKSTLAKILMQLEPLESGKVSFDGKVIEKIGRKDLLVYRRNVQMVFQDPYGSLTPHFRVETLVAEPLRIHRIVSGEEIKKRVAELLESVGLESALADRFPHELSGGQRQRVSIARAIATRPRVIICDEPVSALDVSVRAQIINLLMQLQRDLGLAYFFISHDLGLVDRISDHVCVMYLGRIIEQASAEKFFASPRHPYSRALIASAPQPKPGRRDDMAVIEGEVGVDEPTTGCKFRNRCPHAAEVCAQSQPPLAPIDQGHLVACHRAEELGVAPSQNG